MIPRSFQREFIEIFLVKDILIVMMGFGYDIFEGFLLFGCSSFNGEFGCEIGMDRLKI